MTFIIGWGLLLVGFVFGFLLAAMFAVGGRYDEASDTNPESITAPKEGG